MAASVFDERFAELLHAANRQHGMNPSADMTRAMNALAAIPPQQREGAGPAVANALLALTSPTGAGFLAVWLGAGAEDGAAPEATCRPIIDTFLKWGRTVETLPDTDDVDPHPIPQPDAETIAGLQLLGQAIVAHVACLPKMRKWMRDTAEIRDEFERIAHVSVGAAWVVELLTQCSGQLVVLNAAKKIGVLVRYSNISNCFHLFTLLQGALMDVMPDAQHTDPNVQDIALGRQHGQCRDEAWWHYGQPNLPSPALAGTVWGEMSPSGIANVDGEQVLVLWPAIMEHRGWDAGFFSPILEASLPEVTVLKVLPDAEVDAWWAKLKLPEPQRPAWKSWWRKFLQQGA
jgi:hypothetical protein